MIVAFPGYPHNSLQTPSKESLEIYNGPLSTRQGSWRADNGQL